MGLSPRDVDRLTLAEFACAFDGFRRFHGGADEAPSTDEYVAALAEEMAAGRA